MQINRQLTWLRFWLKVPKSLLSTEVLKQPCRVCFFPSELIKEWQVCLRGFCKKCKTRELKCWHHTPNNLSEYFFFHKRDKRLYFWEHREFATTVIANQNLGYFPQIKAMITLSQVSKVAVVWSLLVFASLLHHSALLSL